MKQRLTHSRLRCFRSCPRRHYLAYELQLRPLVDGYALRVGSGFAAAQEAIANGHDPAPVIEQAMEDPYDIAMVAAMVNGHARRWENDPLETVAAELEFDLPLLNPATGKPTPIWTLAGKVDRIVRLADGRLALKEDKTTNKDFSAGSDYWTQIQMDQQLTIYVNAMRAVGYDIQTILYDVTLRPSLRPLKATPEEKRRYTKNGALYANQRDQDETPEDFAARLAIYIADNEEKCFARIEIPRLEQDLQDGQQEVWQQQLAIRNMQLGEESSWYRNPGACFEPYPCTYLNCCRDRDLATHTPDGFRRSDTQHPELS